jgi:iron uptake system component EfeO
LSATVDKNFATVDAILAKYKVGADWESYDKVTEADRTALKGPVTALAEDLSKLRGVLGLN